MLWQVVVIPELNNILNHIFMQKKSTKEEILKAAEICEVSAIDAKHIVSQLDQTKNIINVEFDCNKCKHSFSNPFDQYYCKKKKPNGDEYNIENNEDCGGIFYVN